MKRLIFGTLSAIALATVAPFAAQAEQDTQVYGSPSDGTDGYPYDTEVQQDESSIYDDFARRDSALEGSEYRTSPFEATYLAYNGYFEEQGIDGYSILLQDVATGDTDAEDVVEAAINSGRLSPLALNDEGYVNSVRFMLQRLEVERG
jgi:hypothetical protein